MATVIRAELSIRMLGHFGSGLLWQPFRATLATFPMSFYNEVDWQYERRQWFAQGWRDPVDWWSEDEWQDCQNDGRRRAAATEVPSPPVRLTRATLEGHAANGDIERQRHPPPIQPFVPGQRSSSTESWPWHHPLAFFGRDPHAHIMQYIQETGYVSIEAGSQAHEEEAPPSRCCFQGHQGGGARVEQVQQVPHAPSSLVGWPEINQRHVRGQELNTDQRAAAVIRTCRSAMFLAVRDMVADGRLADHEVPAPPDACSPCSSSEWDCLMFAWRARLWRLQGTDPLGEPGDGDWARRIRHRSNAVDAVKRSSDYDSMVRLDSVDRLSATLRPRTPDPLDRTLSKRHWEMSVQDWRVRLRRLRDTTRDTATRTENVPKQRSLIPEEQFTMDDIHGGGFDNREASLCRNCDLTAPFHRQLSPPFHAGSNLVADQ